MKLCSDAKRILEAIIRDKRGMVAAPRVPASKPPPSQKQGGSDAQQMIGSGGAPGGNSQPHAEEIIRGHQTNLDNFQHSKTELERKINDIDQQINSAQTQRAELDASREDTSNLDETLKQLEKEKSEVRKQIDYTDSIISQEEKAIAEFKRAKVAEEGGQLAEAVAPEVTPIVENALPAEENMINAHQERSETSTKNKIAAAQSKSGMAAQKAMVLGAAQPQKSASSVNSGLFDKLGSGRSSGSDGEGARMPAKYFFPLLGTIIFGAALFMISYRAGIAEMVWPALIAPALLVVLIIFHYKTLGHKSWLAIIVVLVLIGATGWTAFAFTAPQVAGLYASGAIKESGAETASETKQGLSSAIESTIRSYRQQVAMASGERIDGEVDQQIKDEVGVAILPPYLPNPKKINENEIHTLEIGARVKGFDPKNPIHVAVACNMQTREEAQSVTRSMAQSGKGPRLDIGPSQNVRPDSFEGLNFNNEVTCQPRPESCGHYSITLSVQGDGFRTDAQMQNYIIDKSVLEQRLKNYAESYEKEIRSESELNSAMNEIYRGQLGKYTSVSDKGAIKVVMASAPVALVGVDQDTELTLRVGVENMMKGWIRHIDSVSVTIPEYFDTLEGFCEGWTKEGSRISLTQEYLDSLSIQQIAQGEQKVFPSCHLVPNGRYELTEPTEATFLASVRYGYLIEQISEVEVRNATGGPCAEEARTSGESKAPETTEGTAEEPEPTVTATEACNSKNEGDECGTGRQKCLVQDGGLKCVTQCEFSAAKREQGLSSSYRCVTPTTACAQGTVRSPSCTSDWTTAQAACCIRR